MKRNFMQAETAPNAHLEKSSPPATPSTGAPRRFRRASAVLVALIATALLLLLAAAGHRALDVMVGTPLRGVIPGEGAAHASVGDPRYRSTIEQLIQRPLVAGNRFDLLTSGGVTYPRLWEDLRAAQETITLQMYYCERGAVADSLRDILVERARAGVAVLFLADGFGCRSLAGTYGRALEAAGARFEIFRPIRWYTLHKAQHRSHVRAVVVDGRIGYTGGFGIDDKWYDSDDPEREWREMNVRMAGPAVAQLQAAFAMGWVEATGELLAGPGYFPDLEPRGAHAGAIVHSTPAIGSSTAERLLALSISGARRALYITNAYFVPDAEFRRLLSAAARRGVDVRILTAGPRTDVRTTLLAGRSHYAELLRSGVRVYEYQPAMMHSKALVVDGAWLSLGTMNFDNRSLRLNDESNLVAYDAEIGATLDSIFHAELRSAKEIRLAEFETRPWWDRVLEFGANLGWFVL